MPNRTSVRNFSLLTNGTFRVNFDCYTARPHFIIVSDDASLNAYEDLCDDQKKKVISLALEMVKNNSLHESRAVLSQHCGTWYSSRYYYHAHLCVSVDKYLAISRKRRDELDRWPHNDQDIKDYPVNRMKREVKEIKIIIAAEQAKKKRADNANEGADNVIEGAVNVVEGADNVVEGADNVLFHPSEPRVGFVDEKSNKPTNSQAWFEVQDKLMSYANEKVLLEGEGDYKGCHVCLVLDGETHGKSTLSLS